jgi:uncharacterized tellurite resistance protein B-like protein
MVGHSSVSLRYVASRLQQNPLYVAPMSIWTRISDAAQLVGDSLVAVLSRFGGNAPNAADPERSVAFTIGVIALGAKMAKVDGWVSGAEVTAFKQVFQVEPDELANVARVFNLAKQDVAGFDAYARQLARLFADRPDVLEDVVDSLFHIAKADGASTRPRSGFSATSPTSSASRRASAASWRATSSRRKTSLTPFSASILASATRRRAGTIAGWCAKTIPTSTLPPACRPKWWRSPTSGWRRSPRRGTRSPRSAGL